MGKVRATEITGFLGLELVGADVELSGASAAARPEPGTLVFAKKLTPQYLESLNAASGVLVLAAPAFSGLLRVSHALAPNARLAFAKAVTRFFVERPPARVHPTAVIAASARLGADVSVGAYSVIGEGVEIGEGSTVRQHVSIFDGCRIGKRCLVRSGAVIGEEGFGFEYEDDGTPVRVPHLGSVVVGDDVEIGACTTIARGTLDDTVIGDSVKIDDHVFLAHNVEVGAGSFVIACAEVSGSVKIGRRCWIAPQAAIINGVEIGDDALVGLGAVVQKSIEANSVVTGNPARFIRKHRPEA